MECGHPSIIIDVLMTISWYRQFLKVLAIAHMEIIIMSLCRGLSKHEATPTNLYDGTTRPNHRIQHIHGVLSIDVHCVYCIRSSLFVIPCHTLSGICWRFPGRFPRSRIWRRRPWRSSRRVRRGSGRPNLVDPADPILATIIPGKIIGKNKKNTWDD